MVKIDFYEILGVDKNATLEQIKLKYHSLAKQYHPDVNRKDPMARDKFIVLQKAYEVLRDNHPEYRVNSSALTKTQEERSIYQVLQKYGHLTAVVTWQVEEMFRLLDEWKKLCIVIEIGIHCTAEWDGHNFPTAECEDWLIDCKDCRNVDSRVLPEIESFIDEIQMSGYFAFRNKQWSLTVSKIKSVAYWMSQTAPWENGGLRALVLNPSIKTIDALKSTYKNYGRDEIKD